MSKRNTSPTEDAEQIGFVTRANKILGDDFDLLWHTPNGGKRDGRTAATMKKLGVKPGVPDIFFAKPIGEYAGLFIEMKRQKGGRVSAEQKHMIARLTESGYCVEVANGCEEALNILCKYISGEQS